MTDNSRVQNSTKNILVGLCGQVLSLLLSFINRTVFISTLGEQYLGVNGLFTSILSVLSIAELGVGNAIIYNMYKPLAENNKDRVKKLMKLYADVYHAIGCIIAIIGLCIIPFLDYIVKDKATVPNITLIYILFLANTVISYFFAYKKSIITADQKNYIISIYQYSCNIIQLIVQVIILKLTNNFIFYLLIQMIFSIGLNLSLSRKSDKLYPYIKEKNEKGLNKNEKKHIFKNIYAIVMYKVNAVILNSTDNIVISKFIGIVYVGIYSNYLMIVNSITMILSAIFNSLTASIGNLNASSTTEKKYEIFNTINFISFWLYGFSSICLWNLLNPFIEIWIGNRYSLDNFTILVIIINFYTTGMQYGTSTYRDSTGLFWNGRYIPVVASIINLTVSIILVKTIGISGVLIGTIVSRILTYFWFDPYMIYKNIFNKSSMIYFVKYCIYTLVTIFTAIIMKNILSIFTVNNLSTFIIKTSICVIIPNLIFLIIFYRTKEFKYLWSVGRAMLCKLNIVKIS